MAIERRIASGEGDPEESMPIGRLHVSLFLANLLSGCLIYGIILMLGSDPVAEISDK